MDQADKAVRSECSGIARSQDTDTTIVDPAGLGAGKNEPGACRDGWADPKNIDDRSGGYMGHDTDYGIRGMDTEDNVCRAETDENPNHVSIFGMPPVVRVKRAK